MVFKIELIDTIEVEDLVEIVDITSEKDVNIQIIANADGTISQNAQEVNAAQLIHFIVPNVQIDVTYSLQSLQEVISKLKPVWFKKTNNTELVNKDRISVANADFCCR